jgi:hypothetical protein
MADRLNDGSPQLSAPSKVIPPRYKHHRSPSPRAAPSRRYATSTRRCCPDQRTGPRVSPGTRGYVVQGIHDAIQEGMATPAGAAASVSGEPAKISPEPHHH